MEKLALLISSNSFPNKTVLTCVSKKAQANFLQVRIIISRKLNLKKYILKRSRKSETTIKDS